MKKLEIYLVEFYTKGTNAEIRFAWVTVENRSQVEPLLRHRIRIFDEIITCEQQSHIVELQTSKPVWSLEYGNYSTSTL